MTAILTRDAKALLQRQDRRNRLVQRALQNGAPVTGGVLPIEDALRTYERRLAWARDNGIEVVGASKLLTRLRQSGLSHVAVLTATLQAQTIVFFADPQLQTLLATIGVAAAEDEAAAR